ncbi:MAG TPA: FAD-dependent oxidoreductase, partial [Reyranella sp.]|nr:FAD-dependent oxidoreductase [Reyranella sp.]
ELPNALASSMDEHRLIRHPYGDHIGYARMIDDAFAAWDLMWRDLGQQLYAPTGTLALTGNAADWAERSASEDEIRPLLARCKSLFHGFESWRTDRLKVCFYTVTDDERFVVDKLGAKGWVMSPCSGHGFKFGALMGLELARTIAAERDPGTHARWAAGLEGDTK